MISRRKLFAFPLLASLFAVPAFAQDKPADPPAAAPKKTPEQQEEETNTAVSRWVRNQIRAFQVANDDKLPEQMNIGYEMYDRLAAWHRQERILTTRHRSKNREGLWFEGVLILPTTKLKGQDFTWN